MAADQITVAIDPDVAFIATLRAYNHDGRVDRSLRIKGKLSENKLCRAGLDLVLKCPTRNFNRMVYTHSPLTFQNAYGRRPTASADAFGLIAAHQNALPLSFVVQVLADCLHNSVLDCFSPPTELALGSAAKKMPLIVPTKISIKRQKFSQVA